MSDNAYWIEQLAIAKAQLVEVNARITSSLLAPGGSYRFDTGQTVVHITTIEMSQLKNFKKELQGEIAGLDTRIYGCGSAIAGPM
jgi:hypothetical protein